MSRLVIISVLFCLCMILVQAAPRQQNERQLSFDTDSDTNNDRDTGSRPRGFVQRIFDMIKNLLGFESRRTVVRNDGTVVEIEPENEGFISRITRRLVNIFTRILDTFTDRRKTTDDDDTRTTTTNEDARYRKNEIERELIRAKPESNVVLS